MDIYDLKQIETPRLLIRPPKQGDEIDLYDAIQNSIEPLKRWMPWAKETSLEKTKSTLEYNITEWESRNSKDVALIVINKENNKILSDATILKATDPKIKYHELGYWIDSRYQGQGLVTELVTALTKYSLEALGNKRVQIRTQPKNNKSIAVAKRCGFDYELTLQNACTDCKSQHLDDVKIFSCCDTNKIQEIHTTWESKTNINNTDISSISNQKTGILISKSPSSMGVLNTNNLILLPDPQNFLIYNVLNKSNLKSIGKIWCKTKNWDIPYNALDYNFDWSQTNQDLACEAISEFIKNLFNNINLKYNHLYIEAPEYDQPKINLAKKLGAKCIGTLKNYVIKPVTDDAISTKLFSITNI